MQHFTLNANARRSLAERPNPPQTQNTQPNPLLHLLLLLCSEPTGQDVKKLPASFTLHTGSYITRDICIIKLLFRLWCMTDHNRIYCESGKFAFVSGNHHIRNIGCKTMRRPQGIIGPNAFAALLFATTVNAFFGYCDILTIIFLLLLSALLPIL